MEDKSVTKKKYSDLQDVTMTGYLNTHNSLSKDFNNITMWLNLTWVYLSKNRIVVLPSAFGKLRLQLLDLSENWLGKFDSTKWPWIEQNAIQNTLIALDISNNFLSKLPLNIEKLNCLLVLNVCENLLQQLPQTIGNMHNLLFLNLSCNRLLYLPATTMFLKSLNFVNISWNPLHILRYDNKYKVLSLVELSANVILQHRSLHSNTRLLSIFVEYLEKVNCCFLCGRFGTGFLPIYIRYSIHKLNAYIISQHEFKKFKDVLFEFYCCSPFCGDNSKSANRSTRNIDALISDIKKVVEFKSNSSIC